MATATAVPRQLPAANVGISYLAAAAFRGQQLRVAFVGTYPPTQCGIATFTESLVSSMTAAHSHIGFEPTIIRLCEPGDENNVSAQPVIDWQRDDPDSFDRVVASLNQFDLVIVQHEYGIFSGPDGESIVEFLRQSPIPSFVVLHTVPNNPTPHQREILEDILKLATVSVVQSDAARRRLVRDYPEGVDRLMTIAHGAWTTPTKASTSGSQRPRILTWGLVGPGKGLEHGIDALATVIRSLPSAQYVIAGETHPKVREHEGERYRTMLQSRVADLGLQDNVVFCDRYRDRAALQQLIESADVVLLPYDSKEQVTSGVLVEALAAGKAVASTAFPHAVEALASGAGTIVTHGDDVAMASAISHILSDRDAAEAMRAEARRVGGQLSWPAVAQLYLAIASKVVRQAASW